MTLRVAAAALAGAVVIFVLAGLSFGLLFADFFAHSIPPDLADVSRKETNLALIFVSDLLYASLLAYVFAFLANIRTFRRGAMVGMVLGFTVVLHFDLISAATTRLTTPASMAANAAISTFMSGIGGGVVAAVLGRFGRR